MKIRRKSKTEAGPRFTIETPEGRRDAKHPGEIAALLEAQRIAEKAEGEIVVRVVDEDVVLYVVEQDEDGVVLTHARAAA